MPSWDFPRNGELRNRIFRCDASIKLGGSMNRVVILGRGGAGKSTLASRLGAATGLPVFELDKYFWPEDLTAIPKDRWAMIQRRLVSEPAWILDGDLGPYDVLEVRLAAADTVIVLDFPVWRCAWRALRRSRENIAFWRWMIGYRHSSLPLVTAAIAEHSSHADIRVLRNPRDVEKLLAQAGHFRNEAA
jgi:adenylate kinase family enzyme